jgi:tetratricopeptide (TPR) repeat protein
MLQSQSVQPELSSGKSPERLAEVMLELLRRSQELNSAGHVKGLLIARKVNEGELAEWLRCNGEGFVGEELLQLRRLAVVMNGVLGDVAKEVVSRSPNINYEPQGSIANNPLIEPLEQSHEESSEGLLAQSSSRLHDFMESTVVVQQDSLEEARGLLRDGALEQALGEVERVIGLGKSVEALELKSEILGAIVVRGGIKKVAPTADEWINQGNQAWGTGNYQSALEAYEKAIQIQSDSAIAWNNSGLALATLGRHEEAIASYDKAIELNPDFHFAWDYRGNSLWHLGRYEEAIASYDKAIELKPDSHDAWDNRGISLNDLGRYEEAIASYDKAIELNPDFHFAWNNRGSSLKDLGRYEEAIASHDKAIELKPDFHDAWCNRGNSLWHLGRYEEAIVSYDKAIELKPDYHFAWNGRGSSLKDLGRYEEAIASYDKAIELKPDFHLAWNGRGNSFHDLGRYEEAIASYDKAIELKPDYHDAWNNRGNSLWHLGRHEEAIVSCDKAIELKPYHLAWFNRGISLNGLGRYEEAIASYDKAIELKPDFHDAWFNRGISLNGLGRYEEAIASYDKAIELNPDFHGAWNNRGSSLKDLGRYEEAIASHDKAIELKPDFHDAWCNRGNSLWHLGRYEEAIVSYDKAIELKPDYHFAWNGRGSSLKDLGRYEEAIASYDKAIELKPDYHFAWNGRGSSLKDLGRYEEAIASCDKAIELNPDFHFAWNNRGISLNDLGRYEEAIASYDKAIELNPDFHFAWNNRGISLNDLGRYEEAIASYDKAIELNPDFHFAWSNRGNSLDDLGRYEEAIASYDKAIELNPDFHFAWNNRGSSLKDLGRYEEAIASHDKAIELKPDFHDAWCNRGNSLWHLGRYEEAIVSYDKAIELKSDYHNAWSNRGNSLKDLGRYEEAIASYDKAIYFKPDYYYAWECRGIALHRMRRYEEAIASYDAAIFYKNDDHITWFNRSLSAYSGCYRGQITEITKKHPELCQRGYFGELSCFTIGLTYCPADTHPLGHGYLQRKLGDAHWDYARAETNYRYYWRKAISAYNESLKALTETDHPEERLKSLQKLIRTHDFLQEIEPAAMLALLRQATDLRDRLLIQAPTEEQRENLNRTLPNFNELTVNFLLTQGNKITALETAEADKNGLMQWLISGTATYSEMRQLLTPGSAIVYWYLSANALTSFILRPDQVEPIVLTEFDREISLKTRDRLDKWIKEWNKNYNPKAEENDNFWKDNLITELATLAEILEIPKLLPHLQNLQTLILVPHRDLHRFPLHTFFPSHQVTYLPSLHLGHNLPSAPNSDQTLLAIEAPEHNGTQPLYHAAIESIALCYLHQSHRHLKPYKASQEEFLKAIAQPHSILHFNGHANHNNTHPKHSELALTGSDTLTLEDFLRHPCPTTYLVTLAACETGITNAQTITTEYVGWVSACLGRRIPHVLSTLWTVQSEATALFMMGFYCQLLQHQDPILAHHQAQQWLRTLTVRDLRQFYSTELSKIDDHNLEEFLETEQDKLSKIEESDQPYAHPYYWSAFILSGRPNGL